MEKAKVYFSDLRTSPTSNLLDKYNPQNHPNNFSKRNGSVFFGLSKRNGSV